MKRQLTFVKSAIRHWDLLKQFTYRDIAGRYRGSQLGMAWTVINPLLMLTVYTLVFSQIFRARWGSSNENQGPLHFALNLFAGLIVFNLFSCAGSPLSEEIMEAIALILMRELAFIIASWS